MSQVGTVASLWRYPVKSMAGERLDEAFVGFSGVYGDRLYAFRSSAAPKGFPFLTAREQRFLLSCRPRFRQPESAARPSNLLEAQALAPGVTPLYPEAADLAMEVDLPNGEVVSLDDPALVQRLGEGVSGTPELTLMRSERSLTDCRPVSLLSLQTVHQLGEEIGQAVDPRRFRANLIVDLAGPFAEDGLVGKTLRLGSQVVLSVLERDPRCVLITLDPDTGAALPELLRQIAQAHGGMTGVYAAVLVEGLVHPGDAVEVVG